MKYCYFIIGILSLEFGFGKSLEEFKPDPLHVDDIEFLRFLPDGDIMKTSFVPLINHDDKPVGRFKFPESRIVGGRFALESEAPYQVAIVRSGGGIIHCGGTLIDSQTVVTAAHCFYDGRRKLSHAKLLDEYVFMIGKIDLQNNEATESLNLAKEIVLHPDYNQKYSWNDIAIVKFHRSICFNKNIKPMALPIPGTKPTGTTKISGWGHTKVRQVATRTTQRKVNTFSPHLKIAEIQIISKTICTEIYGGGTANMVVAHRSIICAGNLSGGVDNCQADSGGPMICQYESNASLLPNEFYLCGIVASGIGCGLQNLPAYYTNVDLFINWINLHRPSTGNSLSFYGIRASIYKTWSMLKILCWIRLIR